MEDRLAVAADELNAVHRNLRAFSSFFQRLGIQLSKNEVEARNVPGKGARVRDGEKRLPDFFRVWDRMTRQDIDFCLEARTGDVDNRYINPVERGPAHDTCYSHVFSNSCCKSCRICKASTGRSSLILNARIRSANP